jgi:serine/threonine protein kinase
MARALGRYELLRPLARGGMAEVYLARRRAAGVEKWLVVKRMRPERSGDPRFLDLFVREARLSMSLVHQNIVPVFDFGRIDDQVFLAMERVEGRDLGSSLARAGDHRLPPLLAAFVAAECCQALDYAHQRKGPDGVALGIVHRDVTPRNVLLSWSGEVKLTDFGIAALAGDATSRLLGTPQYMAPEQARSEPIDPRADIYAIGLVLREAITGVRPRPGADRDSMLDAARRGDLLPWSHVAPPPPPDSELALGSGDHTEPVPPSPAPPPALIAIVDRATALTAPERYPDARSMLEDLDAFIVAERASRKVESPARQLAAWLATVWDGARDDDDADGAIEANHLVSFLDDGAPDLIGTGTMRSLAATAADEAEVKAEIAPAPEHASANAPDAAAPGDRDSSARRSRISSSNATIASGSFHTLPAPGDARTRRRKARRARLASGVALIAVASGAAVLWLATRPGDRQGSSSSDPTVPPAQRLADGGSGPAAALAAERDGSARPRPIPGGAGSTPAVPGAAPGASGSNSAPPGTTSAGSNTGSSRTAHTPAGLNITSPGGHGASGHPITGSRVAPIITGAKTGSRSGSPSRPESEPATTGSATTGSARQGPGSAEGSGSPGPTGDRPRAAICRVRINLTPWAFYTTDADSAIHETPGTIDLTPGPHRLHVWNPELHIERDIILDVPADRDAMNYSEPLQPPSLPADAGRR